MDEASRRKYVESVKASVEELRARGIPTVWVAIGDNSELHAAQPGVPRDPALLKKIGLTEVAPRDDEHIFSKRFMDTFTDIKDVRASPELAAYVAMQRPDNILKNGNIEGATFGATKFADLLKSMGAERVTIMGAMAEFCVTDNAMGAAMHGLHPVIVSDRVIGWNDKTYTKPVWHEEDPEIHERSIKSTLEEIKRNPTARGFKASDAKAVGNAANTIEIQTMDELRASLPTPTVRSGFLSPTEGRKPAPAQEQGSPASSGKLKKPGL